MRPGSDLRFSTRDMLALLREHDVKNMQQIVELAAALEPERAAMLLPAGARYLEAVEDAERRFAVLAGQVDGAYAQAGGDRKRFASAFAVTLDPIEKAAAFLIVDGQRTLAHERYRAAKIEQAMRQLL